MTGLIQFCNDMQFTTHWGADVCKLIILFCMLQVIIILTKLIIKWQI